MKKKVIVSITLSKEVEIETTEEDIYKAVQQQVCLPNEAGTILNNVTQFKGTPLRIKNKAIKDLSNWVVDDFTVLEND